MATFFDCPFCDARQTIDEASVGRLSGCPNCKRTVWLFPNVNVPYDQRLSSNWYYETDRFLRLQITAGPIDDLQLVRMIDAGRIALNMRYVAIALQEMNGFDVAAFAWFRFGNWQPSSWPKKKNAEGNFVPGRRPCWIRF